MFQQWFGKKHQDDAHSGLYASLEDLVAMRRYTAYLRAKHRKKSFSHQAGDVKSVFKGRGMEFEEIRAYAFGDDVRDIDWRVTARKQNPYTKLFAEEKDREIYVWLDLSAPMVFGTKKEFKSVTASKIAALLGWLSLENKDRFGCVIFDGQRSWLFKPQSNRGQMMAVFKKISSLSEEALRRLEVDESGALKSFKLLEQNVRHQSDVFVISDFTSFDEGLFAQMAALAHKSRLHILNVYDVLEENPPKAGEYMAEYNGKRLIFDSSPKIYRKDYQTYFADKREKLRAFCRRFGCQMMVFRTDKEIADNLKIL